MLGNLSEKQFEVLIYVQVIRLCCFNQAINNGTGLCTIGRINHYKVLSTDCEWTDSLFEVLIYVQVIRLCCFNQAINNGTGLCTIGRINHYKVLSTDCEWTDSLFAKLFIYEDKHPRMQSDHSLLVGKTGCSVPVRRVLPLALLCIQWLRWQKQMT